MAKIFKVQSCLFFPQPSFTFFSVISDLVGASAMFKIAAPPSVKTENYIQSSAVSNVGRFELYF